MFSAYFTISQWTSVGSSGWDTGRKPFDKNCFNALVPRDIQLSLVGFSLRNTSLLPTLQGSAVVPLTQEPYHARTSRRSHAFGWAYPLTLVETRCNNAYATQGCPACQRQICSGGQTLKSRACFNAQEGESLLCSHVFFYYVYLACLLCCFFCEVTLKSGFIFFKIRIARHRKSMLNKN